MFRAPSTEHRNSTERTSNKAGSEWMTEDGMPTNTSPKSRLEAGEHHGTSFCLHVLIYRSPPFESLGGGFPCLITMSWGSLHDLKIV